MLIQMMPQAAMESTPVSDDRRPGRNFSAAAEFIINGAAKRRKLAFTKARMLQRELGVVAPLVSVK
ncbi:MAG: hypothetical protein VKK59_06655 [Vampirovibrionales bacterium]|nr:hypothetical protein [Vampirovibrionales bacterium]